MGSGGMIVMDETSCMVDVAPVFHGILSIGILWQMCSLPVGTTQIHELLARLQTEPARPRI